MTILTRWSPTMNELDLNFIPLWVQITGIPLQFLTQGIINHIAGVMAGSTDQVLEMDFDLEAVKAVEFVRVKLNWNVDLPLRFQRNFQFSPWVNTTLKFLYERLRGFCEVCGMLTHDTGACVHHNPNPDQDDNHNHGDGNDGNQGDAEDGGPVNMDHEEVPNQMEAAADGQINEADADDNYGDDNEAMGHPSETKDEELLPFTDENFQVCMEAFVRERTIFMGDDGEHRKQNFIASLFLEGERQANPTKNPSSTMEMEMEHGETSGYSRPNAEVDL
ncbi:uncharacterized protein LOC112084644 [Eutrema salsugineum]|uniref:uncharacterized protein LOC112084644 n=1 Tax=Eutrema salsugineum TaxID=72664 RepID=UPI000CED4863|nr:uncharacterized protein LOC112084644 [Eutrema salsugineum]